MTQHIFLTGKKQVGKSTLLKNFLQTYPGKIGGFYTIKTNTFISGKYSVHLLQAGTKCVPKADNLLFLCKDKNMQKKSIERFNQLGCAALNASRHADLIIMDELGPHEEEAVLFQKSVFHVLDGNIPILGVLQEADSPFLQKIAMHPNVQVVRVTEENRTSVDMFKIIQKYIY